MPAASANKNFRPLEVGARFLAVGFYSFALFVLLRDYAAVVWPFYGFSYAPPDRFEVALLVVYLLGTGAFIPRRIESPSSLILIFAYLLIIVPAGICATGLAHISIVEPWQLMPPIGISFIISCVMNRRSSEESELAFGEPLREPHRLLIPVFAAFAALVLAYLAFRFRDIMSFASLDTLYEQRERGAAENLFDGYAQTYSQYFFSPGLVAFGLMRRNIWLLAFGLGGSVINFMITAEKAGLVYPVFMILLFFMLKARHRIFRSIEFLSVSLGSMLYGCVKLYESSFVAEFVAWYLGIRTVMIPGSFIVNYLEFFSQRGYTYFSHIRGLNLIVPVPDQYLNEARWPAIGVIIGEDYFGFARLNANANFIASDGIASLGPLGIPIVIIAFGFLLKLLDKLSAGIGRLAILLLFPLGLTLTNGSLFTVLTSFGGLLWMTLFYVGFSEKNRVSGAARSLGSGPRASPAVT